MVQHHRGYVLTWCVRAVLTTSLFRNLLILFTRSFLAHAVLEAKTDSIARLSD
jgi:hypothetical protein